MNKKRGERKGEEEGKKFKGFAIDFRARELAVLRLCVEINNTNME
jgi:hypothetical protein